MTFLTITDIFGVAALVILSIAKFIFCLFKLRSLSKDLANIQNDCNENSIIFKKKYNINEKMGKPMKTVFIWFGMKNVICQISLTFLLLGTAYKFQEIFKWSDMGTYLWFANCWIVENLIVLPGSTYFGFVYAELCELLCVWSDTIITSNQSNG